MIGISSAAQTYVAETNGFYIAGFG